MNLYQLTVHKAAEMLARREINAQDILESVSRRIDLVEDKIKAFITLTLTRAEKDAKDLDSRSEITGLAGIPCGVQDNLCTRGVATTCASKMLEGFVPPYDATAVGRLKAAGAVMVGKLNMDEFGMGCCTQKSGFHPTSNPWDPTRVSGGSSGGAAAAVAAGEVYYALASDTGGSLRQSAAYCGVVGMRPTYGRVSRYGLVAVASSMDQVGPVTRNVTDCALVLNVICGYDALDSNCLQAEVPDYRNYLGSSLKGMRIGFPREYFQENVDGPVRDAVKKALLKFEDLGAVVEETSLPHSRYALPVFRLLASAEASSNMSRYDGVRYGYRDEEAEDIAEMMSSSRGRGFGPEVKRNILLGTYVLSKEQFDDYYMRAMKVRRLIKEDFDRAFKKYDLLVSPATVGVAFPRGERDEDLSDMLTIPASLAGIPAMCIPGGMVDGLPVGLQLMGPALAEGTLLKAAYAFEQATDYHLRTPVLEV